MQDGLRQRRAAGQRGAEPDADIDLYLQRQNADGTWSADLTSGGEQQPDRGVAALRHARTRRYRLEVHNWAGLPANKVVLNVEFFNGAA